MSSNVFSIKSRKRTNKDKMVGTHIDPDVHSYLSLYVIAKQINKSNLMRNLVTRWYETERKEEPPEKLIRDLIHKAQNEWNRVKLYGGFNTFKKDLEKELEARGVAHEHINRIVENLEE